MTDEPTESTTVFLVEDHATVRRLLAKLVEREPGLELCGMAESAEVALEQIEQCEPQLVLVDVSLPGMDGIELIRLLSERYPAMWSLALSGHDESVYALPALRAGARGYVMKGQALKVVEAIRHVCNGGIYSTDEVRDRLEGRV